MASKTNASKLADLECDGLGEGIKILCIKDHVRSSINGFHVRNRAITNPSFTVGLELKKKEEEDDDEQWFFFSIF